MLIKGENHVKIAFYKISGNFSGKLNVDWIKYWGFVYTGGRDTCQGDSGGGLYVFDISINKYVVAGITRFV